VDKKENAKELQLQHSQAKVEFYGEYLKRYLRILCNVDFIKQINIYDIFCGRGIYKDGKKGSAITAFDIIKNLRNDKNKVYKTPISLFFNDIKTNYTDNIKEYIDKVKNCYCNVEYSNLDTEDIIKNILYKVSKTNNNTRNLIFIDPYGYKKISKDKLFNIMENGKTEIILFLPISQIQRFSQKAMVEKANKSEEAQKYIRLIEFIESFFDENHNIRNKKVSQLEYIRHISDALKLDGKYFVTSYHIYRYKNVGGESYFALFFMSSNIKGFEKVLEVKWKLDESNGQGFNKQEDQIDMFESQNKETVKERHYKKLESILKCELKTPKSNLEMYEIILRNEYLPKHANEIFKKWQNENNNFKVIDIDSKKEARKNSFYLTDEHHKVNFTLEQK